MASFLLILAGYASDEPVHDIDPEAVGDVLTGGVIERNHGRWTVNAHGRHILKEFGLDSPIPVERARASEELSAAAATA